MQYFNATDNSIPSKTSIKPKQSTRFPKIASKPKSLPGENRTTSHSSSLEPITAKAWLYYTPNNQTGFKTNMKR